MSAIIRLPQVLIARAGRMRLAVAALAVLLYVAAYAPLAQGAGPFVASLCTIPVLTITWMFGSRAGFAAALCFVPINVALAKLTGQPVPPFLVQGGLIRGITLLIVVAAVGRLSDLRSRLRDEVGERTRAEEELREVMAHARCLLWRAEITERPGGTELDDGEAYAWRIFMADEAAAQRVLPLDIPPGLNYRHAWISSRLPDDRERMDQNSARALREGATGYRQEFRCRNRHGEVQWLAEEVALEAAGPGRWRAVGICVDITERKAAEEALRQSAESFADMFNAAGEALVIRDGTRILAANQTYAALVGRPVGEVVGSDAFGLFTPESRENAWEQAETAAGRPFEAAMVTEAGAAIPVEVIGKSIRYQGRPTRLVSLRDITPRKRGERALREEERRSRELSAEAQRQARELALLDRVRTALARELDPAAVHRTIVEAISTILGYPRVLLSLVRGDELVLAQLVGYDHLRDRVLQRMPLTTGIAGRVARTGVPALVTNIAADADYLDVGDGTAYEICVPICDEGRVVGIINVESNGEPVLGEADLRLMVALGEHAGLAMGRARLYAEARASAENLAAAQRIAHLGSWEWSVGGDRIGWSAELSRIFGFAPGESPAGFGEFLALVHPDDRAHTRSVIEAALRDGLTFDYEHRIVRPEGAVRLLHSQGIVMRDAAGHPERLLGTCHDITERKALEAQLAHQAFHDALTDLPNRALFQDRLGHALDRAARRQAPIAVLFLDLDRFKHVNDSLGHEAGDELLIAVAGRLARSVRSGDTVARLGGDEFTVILETIDEAAEAVLAAERIVAAFEHPFLVGNRSLAITTSVGVVLGRASQDTPADLLRYADVALYQAKEAGRARYAVFDTAMSEAALERAALEAELRQALERDELTLHYQPKVDLASGAVTGLEGLVRWQHPTRGLLLPGVFIPLAEETGLIRPLGLWVLAEACRQARRWCDAEPLRPLVVSVNVSAVQLRQADFVPAVARILAETGVPPARVQLEITESVLMLDADRAAAVLEALKGLGLGLAIDDFGTGYSSLGYLKRFPIDTVKIDRAFVGGLGRDPEDTAIVRAVIGLAQTLGLHVVAEGVETEENLRRLRELGCELGQGYHFARPLPADEAGVLLARRGEVVAAT
ncbi:MAG: EAL domain-containing protein [Thermomicrobiales bacterium]